MVTRLEGGDGGPGPARSGPTRPYESHGRALSTTPDAARHYQVAQDRHRNRSGLVAALQRAVDADPGFALASADLCALEGRDPVAYSGPLHTWERHHLEVLAAARRDVQRAADLLREHLAVVRCDPVVTAVVVGATTDDRSADLLRNLPGCHYARDA
jgi:hypothetical protein